MAPMRLKHGAAAFLGTVRRPKSARTAVTRAEMSNLRRLPNDFKLRRRGFRGLMPSMTSGRTTHALLESFSLASRAAAALKPVLEQHRLSLDFSSARHCRVDPETPGKLILLVRNSAQHAKLRNLSSTLLSALAAKGLPFSSLEIRVRPLQTQQENEAEPEVEKPRPRSISGAAALRDAAKTARDPQLAALLERLAHAVAPAAAARPLALQLELDDEIERIAAGLDRINDLRVRIPKAPDPALLPSEEAARRSAALAGVRARMLEKRERAERFSLPLDLAEGALKGLLRATRALHEALYGEGQSADAPTDASPDASTDDPTDAPPAEEAADAQAVAVLESNYIALRREAAKALERIEETEQALQMLADEKAAAARRALAAERLAEAAAQAPAKKRDETREALSERLAAARRRAAHAAETANAVLEAIAALPMLPEESEADPHEDAPNRSAAPDFSSLHNERRTLSANHIQTLQRQAARFLDRAQCLLSEIALARSRLPASRSLAAKPVEAAIAQLEELAAVFSPLCRRAADLDDESDALEDRMALIEAELSDLTEESKADAARSDAALSPIVPIPEEALALDGVAESEEATQEETPSDPIDPIKRLEALAHRAPPPIDAFLAEAQAFLDDARSRAPEGPNPVIIPLAEEAEGDEAAQALRRRLLARRDAADAAAAAIERAQAEYRKFEHFAGECLAHGLALTPELFGGVLASLRELDALLKRPATAVNAANPAHTVTAPSESGPEETAEAPAEPERAALIALLMRRFAGPADDAKEARRAAILARAREAAGDLPADGEPNQPAAAPESEPAEARLAPAALDEACAALPPLPRLPEGAAAAEIEAGFRTFPEAVMTDVRERLKVLWAKLPSAPDPKLIAALSDAPKSGPRADLAATAERMKARLARREALEAGLREADALARGALKRLHEPLDNADREALSSDMRRALAAANALQKQLEAPAGR